MRVLVSIWFIVKFAGFGQTKVDTLINCDLTKKDSNICQILENDELNQKDEQGRKQGYWVVYGKDNPKLGYPNNGLIEEGIYINDRKCGVWVKYHFDGKTPCEKITYLNGRPNGEYVKYFDNGNCQEHGYWVGSGYIGNFESYYFNGCLESKRTYNSEGKLEGMASWYSKDCELQHRVFFKNGELILAEYYSEIGYEKDTLQAFIVNEAEKADIIENEITTACFVGNENLKIYNKNKDILMEGEFRENYLWNGYLYVYDEHGILIRIEIWKNGAYSDDKLVGY